MTEKEKLLAYISYKGLSKRGFCDAVGLSPSFLDSGHSFGVDKLRVIKKVYPDLSLTWIVLDEGEMIENDDNQADTLSSFVEGNETTSLANQELIYSSMKRLAEIKNEISQRENREAEELHKMADGLLKELAGLSKQYTNLVNFIRRSFKLK